MREKGTGNMWLKITNSPCQFWQVLHFLDQWEIWGKDFLLCFSFSLKNTYSDGLCALEIISCTDIRKWNKGMKNLQSYISLKNSYRASWNLWGKWGFERVGRQPCVGWKHCLGDSDRASSGWEFRTYYLGLLVTISCLNYIMDSSNLCSPRQYIH